MKVTYKTFDTFDQVKDYFLDNPVFLDEEYSQIAIVDFGDDPSGLEFEGCYVFVAFNSATSWDLDMPRAVLAMDKCAEEDCVEIQRFEYIHYGNSEDDNTPEWPAGPYPIRDKGPGPNDAIN